MNAVIDPIVEKVVTKYFKRSLLGIDKYGTTLEENNTDDFLKHTQEELMDASLYIEKLMSQKNDITKKVLKWASERNLLHKANKWAQYGKLQEESLELYTAMLNNKEEEVKDALGDIGVVMIILANQLGYNFFDCIDKAYKVIKDRKGKTVNGTFVKEK